MARYPGTPDGDFKSFVYEQLSRIGKVLSSPQRLIVLNILSQGEHTVESLARHAGLTVPNLSRHLQILKAANMVRVRKSGRFTCYILSDEETARFYIGFKRYAQRQLEEIGAALREVASSPSRLHAVGREELLRRLAEGDILLIDVRPAEEFRQGHVPGAISIPLEDLERRLGELPREREIVAFCRDRFCILGDQAVLLLRRHGFLARRADDSVVDWKLDGLQLEVLQ